MTTDDGQPSWLTRILLEHPDILPAAAVLAGTREPGDDTRLALRQMLDRSIRDTVRWPRDQDYAEIARDLERAGQGHRAALLREAGSDELLDEALARWAHRYAGRPETGPDQDLNGSADDEQIEYSDDAPVRGIDGALYSLGYGTGRTHEGYVVAVYSRGLGEVISFGDDLQGQRRWVADRGPTSTGELLMPGVAGTSRTVREEKILASLLSDPDALPGIVPYLRPDTFTADARYEIYAAMITLAERGPWYSWQAGNEIRRRAELMPAVALEKYGGSGAPWLHTYVQRLMETSISIEEREAAARSIIEEDARIRKVPGLQTIVADQISRLPVGPPRQQPDVDRWERRRAELGGQARPGCSRRRRHPPRQAGRCFACDDLR